MQTTTVHKMDSSSRYNNNDTASSHSGGASTFVGNNSGYRNNGQQHGEPSRGGLGNQNPSFGAQFSSSTDNNKVKNSNYGCENDSSNTESPYSGWQSLNASVNNASSATNSWNIPDNSKPVMGRSIHSSSSNRDSSSKEENMAVDNNEGSFSGLIGATGGSDEKSNSNNFSGNTPRSMHVPRLGLLGGGENALASQPSNWNGPNSSTWGGINRQSNSSDMSGNSTSENMLVDGDMNFSGILSTTSGSEFSESKPNGNNFRQEHAIPPPRMGLLGGGEGSTSAGWVNSGTAGNSGSGWGPNARTSSSNSVSDLTCTSSSGTSTKPQSSWAQAAGKGLPSTLPPSTLNSGSTQTAAENPDSSTSARDRAEQEAKEFQLKAAFSEGWGQNSVNQDSPWDVPTTPPPENNKEVPPSAVWRAPVNMGTEIWENNLRMNKGSGPSVSAQTAAAPPWGHTPATNIGGHWGDDDSSNMWSGVPPNPPNPPTWTEQQPPSNNSNSNMWGNPVPSEKHWGGSQSSWGDGACGSETGSSVWNSSNNKTRPMSNWSPITTPKKEIPPSGWEPASPPLNRRAAVAAATSGSFDDGTSVWGNPQRQGKVSHWKDMPSAKPIMNSSNSNMVGSNGMLGNMASGPGMIRLPNTAKNDWSKQVAQPPPRGGNWQDMPPPRDSPSINSWGDNDSHHMHGGQMKNMPPNMQGGGSFGVGSWNDQPNSNPLQYWGAKPKSNCNWADGQVDTSSWLGPAKQGGKPLCKDIVHASKQFRILTEMGFRKEDVENALRNNNMNFDEAATELQALSASGGGMEVDSFGGRKVRPANMYDDMSVPCDNSSLESNFSSNNFHGSTNFQSGLNYSFKQQQSKNNVQAFGNMKFPTNSHLRHLVQQIQMAVQAGHLNAQILNQPLAPQTLQFLYQLLQQIKVLTQLQQQQILQTGHMAKQGGVPNPNLQLNVQIAQTKQRINNLQNQICANQALYLKQTIPQQQPPLQPPSHHTSQIGGDIFKTNMEGMGPTLHSEFRDLSIKDMPHHNPQSRLNQWKLSSSDKEENSMCPPGELAGGIPDFSRAPGSLNPKASSTMPNSGSALHPLLEQNDSTWSGLGGGRGNNHGDSGWPEVAQSVTESTGGGSITPATSGIGNGPSSDGKDVTGSAHPSYNLTDLVPEFEPGKPWKGTQLKNIEDDPHITPGSIARSPLSVNNIKESQLFWSNPKTSPANTSSDVTGTLTSSTWGFNAASNSGPNSANPATKSGGNKNGWGSDFGSATDLWGSMSKSRNPPPGISNQAWDRPQNSTFLILRNLTPQIDGSTLKTLCMQHGPLQMFHLFQNGGVALVRYSTREEASKAQSALNNCVLGNTTMLADIPSDTEIQQYLQVSSAGQQQQQAANGSSQANNPTWSSSTSSQNSGTAFHGSGSAFYGGGSVTASSSGNNASNNNGNWNSQLWSFSNTSLWGSSAQPGDHDVSTNPINSFLPGDLLGGEPM